ncbi:MAG TPA: carboxypeptidase-like regulatory domain-containing protein [Vicinamibacterales bacterium]|jgi:hypothetical protein
MPRFKKIAIAVFVCLLPALSAAQGRITGQIVGTVKDASGAVVPKADLVLIDSGTGATVETKSGSDGNFVFPNLQPGRYSITATFQGFQPVTIQEVIVQTARSIDVVVQFQVAGVSEQVQVEGRSQVVETTSTTVANTVNNAQIAKLPMAGRNILNFALLVPGAATSSGGRDSEYNGLPGGAINITLDGVNNNSARFRSGGTSMFVFAPVRLGAIEEVTISTSGLTADAGAEGAVQLQFVTKRGTNAFRGQAFDQISSDRFNAQGAVNKSRGTPKNKLKQHEWGANVGGPIVKNKLFFFGNYERIYQPGETTLNRTVLTAEAQTGVFRYLGSDGVTRTANLLDLARTAGLPTALDPYVQRQLQTINGTLSQGIITTGGNLVTNNFGFVIEQTPNVNYYPTARVDYQATSSLAVRGVLNLHYRDLPTNMRYPGLPRINDGFASTYYILSTGADWTVKPNLFYQMSFGGQSNYEEFRPGNTLDIYAGGLNGMRVDLPLIDEPEIVGDQLPIPRNNPVWNFTNALTWLKGKHSFTFGGTFRRTTMYESIGGAPPTYTIGIGTGDPAANAFTSTTMPGLRDADRTNALALYAMLVGRVSNASGQYNLNTDSKLYELIPALRKEAQNVGGVYAQDQWRINPTLTLNYGLRWEFSGAATNPSEVYSSPDPAGILGPSTAVFQPGVLNGDMNPQIYLKPKPYKGDFNNPAPNVGVAWNPSKPGGFLGKLLGQAVYRGNFGINYYDEGLISFQTAAGNGPGLLQTLALPAFTPGSLNLQTALPAFTRTPTAFTFPIAMSGFTFNRGHSTFDPDIKTPMIKNWSIGYQRELTSSSAIEIRYVGNRGSNLWRLYNLNETNIFENNFLNDFTNAQRNLAINLAQTPAVTSFENRSLPGQVPIPIFAAAFGARGATGPVAASAGYSSTTFITQLLQGQAGRLANTLAGDFRYLCPMVGNRLPACVTGGRNYNEAGPYAINFFQANPFAAGGNARLMTDESASAYDALQLQFRQRLRQGLSVTANYTYGKGRTDRYLITADNTGDWTTLRDRSLNWGPTGYDLRHIFQAYGTYELPFGSGRRFNIDNDILDQAFGGWSASAIVKVQTGRPFLLTSGRQTFNQQDSGVILNGITVADLQKMVKVSTPPANDSRFPVGNVLYLDPRLIGADGRANQDYIRYPTTAGELGQYVYLYGPGLVVADLSVAKTFSLGGQRRFNFEALFINAFNHRNTTVGGTGGTSISIDSTTFGQSSGVANVSTNGARQVQFRVGYTF